MAKRRKYQDANEQILPDPSPPQQLEIRNEREADRRRPISSGNTSESRRSGINGTVGMGLLPLRIAGSLTAGIVLMTVLSILLAWGSFVESEYGRSVASFVLYESSWFAGILALLALNIACSMLLRFPWKRHHLPFLTAHTGILILLVGSFLTWTGGEEAQITLPEGAADKTAVKTDRRHFELENVSFGSTEPFPAGNVRIAFEPGPFSWQTYSRENWLRDHGGKYRDTLWLAMQWGHRDRGALRSPVDLKNVRFEVLDFLAGSATEPVPPLELSVLWKKTVQTTTELGDVREHPRSWERVKLDIRPQEHIGHVEIRGTQVEMSGGERVCFYVTTSMTEVEAFRQGVPDTTSDFGLWGRIILYAGGKSHDVDVDRLLRDTEGGKRVPLPGTAFQIGDVRFRARGPIILFTLYAPDGTRESLTLDPDRPELDVQARVFGVFGSYWVDAKRLAAEDRPSEPIAPARLERLARPRLDILQGPDRRLYYRFWCKGRIASKGVVPETKTRGGRPTFSIAPNTADEAEIVLERFVPHDLPGLRIVSRPVGRAGATEQRVKLRVTVDGKEDTFWLRASYPSAVPLPRERDQIRHVYGKDRSVGVVWNYDSIDLGFGIFLKRFERRTEPGTRMSSHYASLVDFVDPTTVREPTSRSDPSRGGFRALREDVLIQMNQPAVFRGNGRRYRIYQSAYDGPFHPGDYRFQELYDGRIFPWENRPRETLYMSKLSINDDPGRGLKYLGGFLIVFGTAWLFYRKK